MKGKPVTRTYWRRDRHLGEILDASMAPGVLTDLVERLARDTFSESELRDAELRDIFHVLRDAASGSWERADGALARLCDWAGADGVQLHLP